MKIWQGYFGRKIKSFLDKKIECKYSRNIDEFFLFKLSYFILLNSLKKVLSNYCYIMLSLVERLSEDNMRISILFKES